MGRYIRKHTRIASMGPTEERGFAVWVGYDLVGVDEDLSRFGLVSVEGWPDDRIAGYGVVRFIRVEAGDAAMYDKLGIRRNE